MYYFQKQENFPLRVNKLLAVSTIAVGIGLIVSHALFRRDSSPEIKAFASEIPIRQVETSAHEGSSSLEASVQPGQDSAPSSDIALPSFEDAVSVAVAEKIRSVALMVELSEQQRARLEQHFRQRIALSTFRGSPESLRALRAEIEPFEAIIGAEAAASYRNIESQLGEQRSQLLLEQSLIHAMSVGEFSTDFRREILNELHLATNAGLSFSEIRQYMKSYLRSRVTENQARLLETVFGGDRYIQGEQLRVLRQATETERQRVLQYYQNRLSLSDAQAGEFYSLQSAAFGRYQELTASGKLAQTDALREVTAQYRRALEQLLTPEQWLQYEKLQGGAQEVWDGF